VFGGFGKLLVDESAQIGGLARRHHGRIPVPDVDRIATALDVLDARLERRLPTAHDAVVHDGHDAHRGRPNAARSIVRVSLGARKPRATDQSPSQEQQQNEGQHGERPRRERHSHVVNDWTSHRPRVQHERDRRDRSEGTAVEAKGATWVSSARRTGGGPDNDCPREASR